jgi:pentafunctional AROM polypeptide
LQIDKTRPAYVEDMMGVWLRRKPYFQECSNIQYYSQHTANENLTLAAEDFERFLSLVTGQRDCLKEMARKQFSFFVSLTFPDLRPHVALLEEIAIGSDAVELRADLLQESGSKRETPSVEYVMEQLSLLRSAISLPVIFTIRTKSQGGSFPDDAYDEAFDLYQLALRMGCEFVDLEIAFPEPLLQKVTAMKGFSKIIASHHDPQRKLSWSDGSWIPHYNKALQYGDVVKLVGVATQLDDNFALRNFKTWAASQNSTPLIAINMHEKGQPSRILNAFLTPVGAPPRSREYPLSKPPPGNYPPPRSAEASPSSARFNPRNSTSSANPSKPPPPHACTTPSSPKPAYRTPTADSKLTTQPPSRTLSAPRTSAAHPSPSL